MQSKELLDPILDDEALTRGLGDPEARMLIEWLVDQAEALCGASPQAAAEVRRLCRWGRAVSRFVHLWCYRQSQGPAIQLAASEGFKWPLPATWIDPCELMEHIVTWQEVSQASARHLDKVSEAF
jgi:hypothetical protein